MPPVAEVVPAVRGMLEETRIPVIADAGELWEKCHITATPLVVRIDEHGRIAEKEVTHNVDRIALAKS